MKIGHLKSTKATEPDFWKKSFGVTNGEKPHFGGIFYVFCQYPNFPFKQSSFIPNNSQKLHVLEKSGSGWTVVDRPLFLRLFVWYHIMTEWCGSLTWNLDRMCASYSCLKLKIEISKFFSKKFSKFFFTKNCCL